MNVVTTNKNALKLSITGDAAKTGAVRLDLPKLNGNTTGWLVVEVSEPPAILPTVCHETPGRK